MAKDKKSDDRKNPEITGDLICRDSSKGNSNNDEAMRTRSQNYGLGHILNANEFIFLTKGIDYFAMPRRNYIPRDSPN